MNTTSVDAYLQDGCGRCEHYQSPLCKVHRWVDELQVLRATLLVAGLDEGLKWGAPCFTIQGRNVAMLAAFRHHCALSFFEGAALVDDHEIMVPPGPNSRYARVVRFSSVDEIAQKLPHVRVLIVQAIEHACSGDRFVPDPVVDAWPPELDKRFATDEALSRAFYALTPGRQRSHILHIAGAKQASTRERRVTRCVPDILAGKGFNER